MHKRVRLAVFEGRILKPTQYHASTIDCLSPTELAENGAQFRRMSIAKHTTLSVTAIWNRKDFW